MSTRPTTVEARHKVLLVDDDAVSLELMALLLAHEGHQVMRAHDAGDALKLLAADRTARPDVLLVDLQMPGVSGGQLAERVRAMDGPGPLLLAMSATEAKRQQLMAFDGFLLKPLAVEDLRKALKPRKGGQRTGGFAAGPKSPRTISSTCENIDNTIICKLLTMMPEEALASVVAACIADTRTCIGALQTQQLNDDEVRSYAHRIKGAAAMIGASRMAKLAAGLETGVNEEAATRAVLNDLLNACSDLERMLLAGKFKKTRAPHHEPTDRDNTGNT